MRDGHFAAELIGMIDVNTFPALFLDMEERDGLFHLRLPDGTYYWDLVRYDVFGALYHAYGAPFESPTAIPKAAPSFVKNVVKRVIDATIRWRIAHRRPKFLFYTIQRAKHEERLVDLIADPVFDLVKRESVAMEFANINTRSVSALLARGEGRLPAPLVRGSRPLSAGHQAVRELRERLSGRFDRSIDLPAVLTEPLAVYFQYRRHFSRLFARHAPKAIVVNNNGLLKGLFAAARAHRIPTLELQHGATSPEGAFWSYPRSIRSDHAGLTLPTAFLTFADYWTTQSNYPVRHAITIGNRHLFQPQSPNTTGDVAVISAYMYQKELGELARHLATRFPERRFYFKLHPHQFKSFKEISGEFALQPNVRIVTDDLTLTQLFTLSDFVIGIYSTALYSALQANKNVMIYRRANYSFIKDIFAYCELFSSPDEAASIISNAHALFRGKARAPVFFAPFDTEACRHALESVREN
jgi:hypothetical protein